jgi:hypothetical protein
MAEACESEMFQRGWWIQTSYPPGGTPRLYGKQDARRYGNATERANVNLNCHGGSPQKAGKSLPEKCGALPTCRCVSARKIPPRHRQNAIPGA